VKKFYLTGQRTFGNRGCEAIVRSTALLLKKCFGEVTIFVPSDIICRDMKQWPDANNDGIIFVPIYHTFSSRLWGQVLRLPVNWLRQLEFPLPMPKKLKEQLESVDAVLSIGGDMYTYEGRYPVWIMAMDNYAMKLGKPVFLWCASVGPFEAEPSLIPLLKKHFSKMELLALRESTSKEYVSKTLDIKNSIRTSDPAFHLKKSKIDLSEFWPKHNPDNILGLNVSPLIERFASDNQEIITEVINFIRHVITENKLSILLISHVTPLGKSNVNNDHYYMSKIINALPDLNEKVCIINEGFNAEETKYAISKCRFFIGARTHATIAAISSGVPTISIAYSQKAKGLNMDIFGHNDYVLQTNLVSKESLVESLQKLIDQEEGIRKLLTQKIPYLQELTVAAMDRIADCLNKKNDLMQ